MKPFTKGTKPYLFEKLANPDENGVSRWVSKTEFVDDYSSLYFENGASWCRKESSLAKKYIIEFDKSVAVNAGVGSFTVDIRIIESVNHTFLEPVTEIINVMFKS